MPLPLAASSAIANATLPMTHHFTSSGFTHSGDQAAIIRFECEAEGPAQAMQAFINHLERLGITHMVTVWTITESKE